MTELQLKKKRGGHSMNLQYKTIQCSACGATFTFGVEEQEFFASKGFDNEPKRCPSCRQARKSGRYVNSCYSSPRHIFAATCVQCGKSIEVPHEPGVDTPVYCSDCYHKVSSGSYCHPQSLGHTQALLSSLLY